MNHCHREIWLPLIWARPISAKSSGLLETLLDFAIKVNIDSYLTWGDFNQFTNSFRTKTCAGSCLGHTHNFLNLERSYTWWESWLVIRSSKLKTNSLVYQLRWWYCMNCQDQIILSHFWLWQVLRYEICSWHVTCSSPLNYLLVTGGGFAFYQLLEIKLLSAHTDFVIFYLRWKSWRVTVNPLTNWLVTCSLKENINWCWKLFLTLGYFPE